MAKPKKKNAGKNAQTKLVEGPNTNGGKLWSHGPPRESQVPGTGRPPSEIRQLFRGDLLTTREKIIEVIGGREPCSECGRVTKDADLIRLADFFAKYGLGPAKDGLEPTIVTEMAEAVGRIFEADDDQMQELFRAWSLTLGRHADGD